MMTEPLPTDTDINKWNSLVDFHQSFEATKSKWHIIKTADELKPYIHDPDAHPCSIVVMPAKLFNRYRNQCHFWILFGKMRGFDPITLYANDIPIRFLGNWYLMISDLAFCTIKLDEDDNAQIIVGLNFKYTPNKSYVLKWGNPTPKVSVHDRSLYLVTGGKIDTTFTPDSSRETLSEWLIKESMPPKNPIGIIVYGPNMFGFQLPAIKELEAREAT